MTPALLLAALAAQAPAAQTSTVPTAAPTPGAAVSVDTTGAAPRDSAARPPRARPTRRPVRRIPVTPALEASAFATADARTLLQRARVARLAQDSALAAYEARTYQRMSAGMGVRAFGRERLLFRSENAARVTWARGRGVTVEPTGSRTVVPVANGDVRADFDDATPIPYFPGRESLWLPSSAFGVARAEVDDREFVHPLATGSEAYYRYATGGTTTIRLPDGRRIALRELRVTPRRPEWRLFVGSFWLDGATGQLVRAAYRMSVDLDVWQVAGQEAQRDLEEALARARVDTSAAARAAVERERRDAKDDEVPFWVKGMLSPLSGTFGAITVEYGLYEGRFWLPRRNVAEGQGRAGFLRFPFSLEESYRYDRVAGLGTPAAPIPAERPVAVAPTPAAGQLRTAIDSALAFAPTDTSDYLGETGGSFTVNVGGGRRGADTAAARAARVDSALRAYAKNAADYARRADSAQAAGDTARASRFRRYAISTRARAAKLARREVVCRSGATAYDAGTTSRFEGALPVRVRRPCDEQALATSPELPKSPYEPGEQVFGSAERDALLEALDFSLQPGWAPRPPEVRTGLAFARFNRVEAFSLGAQATQVLGRGYTAQLGARLGVGDWVPNADLSLSRTDGRRTVRAAAYQRLAVANDDWGNPLGLGASAAAALYGRDEGFYYRAFGAELGGTRPAPLGAAGGGWNPLRGATFGWRLFAERQRGASVEIRQGLIGPNFVQNIAGDRTLTLGAAGDLARTFGVDPTRTRLATRVRAEGAWARYDRTVTQFGLPAARTSPYARGMAEATMTRPLGALAASLTGAAGAAAGDRVPVQRQFYVGGLQTVRGQFAQPLGAGYAGTSFWLGRTELGLNSLAARPVVFYDVGWAGPRDRWTRPGRPLSGAGVGASFLDGILRADLSRGIAPQRAWRFDLSLDARF